MEQYAAEFEKNHINGEVLLGLSAQDMVAMKVVSVGHRSLLLKRIHLLQLAVKAAAARNTEDAVLVSASSYAPANEAEKVCVCLVNLYLSYCPFLPLPGTDSSYSSENQSIARSWEKLNSSKSANCLRVF